MEENGIRSGLARDDETVALGDTQPLGERLVDRIGEFALLCALVAACGNMGLENRHDMFLLKYLSVFARFRGSARILVEEDRDMFREQIGILKQKAVAGVGIENEPCIGKEDRKSVVSGKSVSVRVALVVDRSIKKKI